MLVFSDVCFPVHEQNHVLIFQYEDTILDGKIQTRGSAYFGIFNNVNI